MVWAHMQAHAGEPPGSNTLWSNKHSSLLLPPKDMCTRAHCVTKRQQEDPSVLTGHHKSHPSGLLSFSLSHISFHSWVLSGPASIGWLESGFVCSVGIGALCWKMEDIHKPSLDEALEPWSPIAWASVMTIKLKSMRAL